MKIIQSITLLAGAAHAKHLSKPFLTARLEGYPGSSVTPPSGAFKIEAAQDGAIKISYDIKDAKPNSLVKFHVHSGITCDDKSKVGGHFWAPFAEADPQNDANGFAGTTDAKGKLSGTVTSNIGYSLDDVTSHTIVVHDGSQAGAPRIGCAVIKKKAKASTTGPWTAYPYEAGLYDGPQPMPTGSVSVYENTQGTATVSFVLGNMLGSGGGLHIHAGTSCDDANDSAGGYDGCKGHYYNVNELTTECDNDPWKTSWTTKNAGTSSVAEGAFNVDTKLPISDLANKVIIIHDGQSNKKAWCAELQNFEAPQTATASDWTLFPNYKGPQQKPTGSVSVTANSAGDATISFSLGNMLGSGGGLHIHAGTSCDDANDSAGNYDGCNGHYYNVNELTAECDNDPWKTSWAPSPATGSFIVDTQLDFELLADKVVILHDADSNAKSWCSKLQGIDEITGKIVTGEWEQFPGYSGPQTQPAGSVTVSQVSGGAKLDYSLSGLIDGDAAKGLHIHAGTSCDDANDSAGNYDGCNGHYYNVKNLGKGCENDPWKTSWSISAGTASGSFKVDTKLPFSDLANKVIIIHDADSNAKSWCAKLDGPDPESPQLAETPMRSGGFERTQTSASGSIATSGDAVEVKSDTANGASSAKASAVALVGAVAALLL